MEIGNQLGRIKAKFELARVQDRKCEVFGASSHQYKLNKRADPAAVVAFETQCNVELPLEFKQFLIEVGDGGAGPYYGIYPLAKLQGNSLLPVPCKLKPDLTAEEWAELTRFATDEALSEEDYEYQSEALFQGMLNIGTQGCTYEIMLIISGEHQGRVVYIDLDYQHPFFTYEKNFLDWYERWLDEIIKGYRLSWFGMDMGGDDRTLMQVFWQSDQEKVKTKALEGMHKLPQLSPEAIVFLEEQCYCTQLEIQKTALGLLTKHCFSKAKVWLEQCLSSEDETIRLMALQFIHWYAGKHVIEVADGVKALLEKTQAADNFAFITYILEKANHRDYSVYLPFFNHPNQEIRRTALYTVGKFKGKKRFVKDFMRCLAANEPTVIHAAVQALNGVIDRQLLPYYQQLLAKYPNNEFFIRNNIMINLKAFGGLAKKIVK